MICTKEIAERKGCDVSQFFKSFYLFKASTRLNLLKNLAHDEKE